MTEASLPAEDAPHLLVVDDDRRIRNLLSRFLTGEGYRVSAVADAAEAEARLGDFVFDLVVLDVMMPRESGLAFAARLRASGAAASGVPILMLTARSETKARVEGLETGADDYLGKPFEPRELSLRIASILRRTRQAARDLARSATCFGAFSFDMAHGVLMLRGEPVHLTSRERDLLRILAQENGVVSRQRLALRVGSELSERSVDVEIARLRRKLPGAAHCLQTVRGRGYRLVATGEIQPGGAP
ncbi:MAG TPA: response regulator transcription factor [Methylocystis sp.]|nr:response regulator transcription factor [Methylocystis sp.]